VAGRLASVLETAATKTSLTVQSVHAPLRTAGWGMAGIDRGIAGTDWTDAENDLLVADYFEMLGEELAGAPYVKATHRRLIVEQTRRPEKSVEWKYRNVSAVLEKLGLPRIRGYAPAEHAQFHGLAAAIDRYLSANGVVADIDVRVPAIADDDDPFVEPPILRNRQPLTPEPIIRLTRKFDPVARDARNRALGKKGEEFVLDQERRRLVRAGRLDLLPDLRWVSEVEGDGAGYDIRSFEPTTGEERLIEVKSTYGGATMGFFLSRSEESLSLERPNEFRLYRVFDLSARPRIFALTPPLRAYVHLETANWRASFR
jgi:hypothetical protein